MKRTKLVDQWKFLDKNDLATLNVGRGTIEVFDPDTQKPVPHTLLPVYVDMIKEAYERGLAHRPLY
jgi:hypothetical protein